MSEKEIADSIGAELVKNSGRGTRKGDMLWNEFVVDAKEGKSFVLNEKSWSKICMDTKTYGVDSVPMLLRVLDNGARIACIPLDILEELIDTREDWNHHDCR